MNKLEPIAELMKDMLEEKFNIEAKYSFEEKKDWLLNVPNRDLYNGFWDDISYTYNKLVDNKLGTSGFYKLRSEDLLFPKMHPGEKQDNRLRQRAFRDFLKDIVPVKLGYNPYN